ncbi:MAG: hypothetical protein U1E20_00370 [Methylocystis sp.]|uniref:hypothetical protein n=1 Tax=Methylocystis sp. TaxID=1911079 RepID=UPI003934530D
MSRKILIAGAAACLLSTEALAANAACPSVSVSQLQNALRAAISETGYGGGLALGLNMWATIVAPDGVVCVVANSSGDPIQGQWLSGRVMSAQKAFTAVTLSLGLTPNSGSGTALAYGKLALSSANLYAAVNPGGSLYGLQHGDPVAAAGAYGDRIGFGAYQSGFGSFSGGSSNTGNLIYTGPTNTTTYGTGADPMIGQVIGGLNVFGGGLALYAGGNVKVGGLGVDGDTSCADHLVAWRVRKYLNLDHLRSIAGVGGAPDRPDNIVFDIIPNPNGGMGVSPSGWGHPSCLGVANAAAQLIANSLPPVSP